MIVGLITLSLGGSLPFFVKPVVSNFYSLVMFRFELFTFNLKINLIHIY